LSDDLGNYKIDINEIVKVFLTLRNHGLEGVGGGLLQSRLEKGLSQDRDRVPPKAAFIPSQPLVRSQVGFCFLRRSMPCKKRRVWGRFTFRTGI